jgi:hypothetical protein
MPTSSKRVDANRANAAKSTGPRTPEGREKSKLNATTHGLTAQTSVLPGEDREELEALSRSLMRQLNPRGVVQRLIAERAVSITWKLRRVARAEEEVARQMDERAMQSWEHERALNEATEGKLFAGLGPKPRRRSGGALLADSIEGGRLVSLTQYELKLDAALRAAVRELRNMQRDGSFCEEEEEEERDAGGEEMSGGENEANGRADSGPDTDPGLRCAAPAACQESEDAAQGAVEKTNPTPEASEPQDLSREGVTDEQPRGSSAPAPGTSAFPPPGPRR